MFASSIVRRIPLRGLAGLLVLAPSVFAGNTWYVDDDGAPTGNGTLGNPYRTIQSAILASGTGNGDTIVVLPGVYRERVDFGVRSVAIVSQAGPDVTIIDAAYRGSAVTIHSGAGWDWDCRVEGFTLRNGTGRFNPARGEALGGAVYCVNSRLSLVDCKLVSNSTRGGGPDSALAGRGGAIFAGVDSEVVLQGCTVAGNDAVGGGGLFLDRGSVWMSGGSIVSNRAMGSISSPGRGGGILAAPQSHLTLSNVLVQGNLALGTSWQDEALGGGLRLEAGSQADIDTCTIEANDSGGWSLGYGDLPGYGGGVSSMAQPADFSMRSTLVRGNYGNSGGGGVHGRGRLESCSIEANHGQFGGGVHAIDMSLYGCTLRSNWGSVSGSYDWGGGIFVGPGSSAYLESCELDSNHAWGQGGGGFGGTYVDCSIHDNFASGDAEAGFVAGGGVYGGVLTHCRVWDNAAEHHDYFDAEGGGLYGCEAAFCIVHDNVGDVFAATSQSQLERCTIANNESYNGGAAVGYGAVHNSIVRFNLPSDIDGTTGVTWSNVPVGTPGVGNVFADPMLWNVGSRDYRLQPGSPCIDAGDPTSPADPDGSRADMGALPLGLARAP